MVLAAISKVTMGKIRLLQIKQMIVITMIKYTYSAMFKSSD